MAACDDFVTKPIRIDLLLEKISGHLGIEWEAAPTVLEGIQNGRNITSGKELLVAPAAEEIEGLYELAMLGDMLKIEKWAADLEAGDQTYRGFAEKLRELAGGFKARAIVALVEQYRGDSE